MSPCGTDGKVNKITNVQHSQCTIWYEQQYTSLKEQTIYKGRFNLLKTEINSYCPQKVAHIVKQSYCMFEKKEIGCIKEIQYCCFERTHVFTAHNLS